MFQIFFGSLTLSLIHAAIPNHWLPLVAIGKSEDWDIKETLTFTGVAGLAHTLSTIIIGILVGLAGYTLSEHYTIITQWIAPIILIGLGLIYLATSRRHSHIHNHLGEKNPVNRKSKSALVMSLALAMFFSPCIEIEAYYFQAGTMGWKGIFTVSIIYTVITVLGMMALVYLSLKGVKKMRWDGLERHEKKITGVVLLLLGLMTFFVEI